MNVPDSGPQDNRPPSKPPTFPPPPPPPPSGAGHMPPARRDPIDARSQESTVVATTGWPGQTTRPTSGEERTPRSAAAPATAAREGDPTPGASFRTPQPLGPPRFAEGEHRLVGRVGPLPEAEAEIYARLIAASRVDWPGPQILRPAP